MKTEIVSPDAKIICDSISPDGIRLTTMQVVMHRFVLAEFNTHRVFSRNSASSRAIPLKKSLEKILAATAYPVHWGAEKPGMQSGEALTPKEIKEALNAWNGVKSWAVYYAQMLQGIKLHKSLINRLLEPFMWHTVVVTSTEWSNFFTQRCSALAQPEIKAAADKMQEVYYLSKPLHKNFGDWHLPFVDSKDVQEIYSLCDLMTYSDPLEIQKKVSAARCARTSYETQEGKRDIQEDLNLFDRLVNANPMHASPFEHQGTPCTHVEEILNFYEGEEIDENDEHPFSLVCRKSGNFGFGWHQYRKMFAKENRLDFVPNLPELQHLVKPEENK